MSWLNTYDSPVPTTTTNGGVYSSPPPAVPATTTSPPAGNYYQTNGFATITTTTFVATTAEVTDIGGNGDWSGNTSGPTPNQGAIIALGVICGLLTIGLAALLFFLFYLGWQHEKPEKVTGGLTITPRYQSMGIHKHRHDRTDYRRGRTDDMTDYLTHLKLLNIPRRHGKSHRRSQPVTSEEDEGISRAGTNPAHWENPGVQPQPAAYAQFPNPGAPVYFSPDQGNRHAVPVGQGPINPASAPPRHRGGDGESAGEQSEVSSSSQEEIQGSGHRHSSVRRYRSNASSSARGRPARNL